MDISNLMFVGMNLCLLLKHTILTLKFLKCPYAKNLTAELNAALLDVILGQNYIRFLDAVLDHVFFSKICFIESSVNML